MLFLIINKVYYNSIKRVNHIDVRIHHTLYLIQINTYIQYSKYFLKSNISNDMHINKRPTAQRTCIVLTNVHTNVRRTVDPVLAYYILSTQIYRLIRLYT